MEFKKIINVAVIAHVDAGKSTLVDAFLNQSHVFSDHEEVVDCVMDSNDLERERGITSYSKNCSIKYKDYEYLWQADSKFWGRHAPVLFPIVGKLKNNECTIKGETYNMSQHGFARDMDFEVFAQTENSITLMLTNNEETMKKYPYEFEWLYGNKQGKVNSRSCGL